MYARLSQELEAANLPEEQNDEILPEEASPISIDESKEVEGEIIAQKPERIQRSKAPKKQAKKRPSVKRSSDVQYYLQCKYTRMASGKVIKECVYWDGTNFRHKDSPPKRYAKVYSSKTGALTAAKKLQRRLDRYAVKVRKPEDWLRLVPVRVTWKECSP